MKIILFFSAMFLLFCWSVFADDIESSVFAENFRDEFPPTGWTILSKNPEYTWEQKEEAFEGLIEGFHGEGDKFAFVIRDGDNASNEMLVTKKYHVAEIPIKTEGYPDLYLWLNFCLAWKDPVPFGNDFTVEISKDYGKAENP